MLFENLSFAQVIKQIEAGEKECETFSRLQLILNIQLGITALPDDLLREYGRSLWRILRKHVAAKFKQN